MYVCVYTRTHACALTHTHSLKKTLNCYCFAKERLLLYSFIDQVINDIHVLRMLLKYGEYKKQYDLVLLSSNSRANWETDRLMFGVAAGSREHLSWG